MSAAMAARRRKTMTWMAGAAGVAALLGAASFLPPGREQPRAEVGSSVLPDFAANAGKIGLVMVTTSEESYHLVHNADGWVLSEKGSYPVEADRIAQLTRALSEIKYARPMTRDDKKFDRIGLGDPLEGGTGALLDVGDGSGTSFAKLIVGYRDGTSYVRQVDDLQAWAVDGATLPPLQRGARWLDLDVVATPADTIAEVFIRPAQGPGYRLLPADVSGQQFTIAPPYANRRVLASFAPTMTAQALTRFAPIDVAPADTVARGAPLAEYVVRTRSGVAIIVHGWRANERAWVTIGAAASETASPEALAQAQAINDRAAGWAFALTELDWGTFSTPLAALVE
ncbi:MAG: DUF4340 domain-containing protein [Hyphomonadaceae bacterium]|nr:DUF4340 domain-containing protein [Hyphomonadaceae bacterium]